MKLFVPLILLAFGLLTACGSTEPLQEEEEYESFRDTVNSDEFTGFTYLLSDFRAEEDDSISTIEEVFDNSNESLYFINGQEFDDATHSEYNADFAIRDIYLPKDKVAYIEDGHVVDEFDVTEDIHSGEKNNNLAIFIQNYQ